MMGLVRLGLVLLIGLTILYVAVSLYARSLARERLERRWDAKPHAGKREDFLRAGMKLYARSARRKVLLVIYIVPPLAIAVLIYLTNFH